MANTYTPNTKHRQPAAGDFDWDDEVNDNSSINDVIFSALKSTNRIISGLLVSDGGALDADYTSGVADVSGTRYSPSASSILLTASSKNFIYVNSSGVISVSTTELTGEFALMAMVDTDATSILRIADLRPFGYQKIQLVNGVSVDEFSSDGTFAGNSDLAVPTEKAVKTYIDGSYSNFNLLLDPDFNINHRGYPADDVTTLADNVYGHDMWCNRTGSTQKYYIDGSGNIDLDAIELGQKNDLLLAADGKTVTFSIQTGAVQIFGIGITSWQTVTPSTPYTWTLSATGNSGWFEMKISGTDTFTKPKIEIGNVATRYEKRHIGLEYILCYRYTWGTGPGKRIGVETSRNATAMMTNIMWPVEMRTTPTCTVGLTDWDGSAASSATIYSANSFGANGLLLDTAPGAGTWRFTVSILADASYYV